MLDVPYFENKIGHQTKLVPQHESTINASKIIRYLQEPCSPYQKILPYIVFFAIYYSSHSTYSTVEDPYIKEANDCLDYQKQSRHECGD